jgi:hypothetical protein
MAMPRQCLPRRATVKRILRHASFPAIFARISGGRTDPKSDPHGAPEARPDCKRQNRF